MFFRSTSCFTGNVVLPQRTPFPIKFLPVSRMLLPWSPKVSWPTFEPRICRSRNANHGRDVRCKLRKDVLKTLSVVPLQYLQCHTHNSLLHLTLTRRYINSAVWYSIVTHAKKRNINYPEKYCSQDSQWLITIDSLEPLEKWTHCFQSLCEEISGCFCVVLSCECRGLATGRSPNKGVLQSI